MSREPAKSIARKSGPGRHDASVLRHSLHRARGVVAVSVALILAASLVLVVAPGAGAAGSHCRVLKVPSQYLTIQAAINAAHPCDTILIAPGTYVDQLMIDKSISVIGSGAGVTTIQGPAVVTPDALGNPWMVELGGAATVNIEGVTVLMTLQCIVTPIPATPTTVPEAYAGGAIGVGGSAYLNLQSAIVTTTGATEGAACGGPSPTTAGIMSYGDGIGFGLDYALGSPPPSALLGFGQVVGVTISGFGYNGEPIGIGGHVDSAAGSSALISHDSISISTDATGYWGDIDVGGSFYAPTAPASATISNSVLTGSTAVGPNDINVYNGSAYIAHNSISVGPDGVGVLALGAVSVTVLHNSIIGPTTDFAYGVAVGGGATGTISYNTIGQFECAYNSTFVEEGLCGPSYATQAQLPGIFAAGSGTVVATHNQIYDTDAGVELVGCSPNCVVQNNVITNSYDYGLAGADGSYSFGPNVIDGGAYGVAAIAYSVNTAIALSNVLIVGPSVAPFYYEVDFAGGTATITGTWIVLP